MNLDQQALNLFLYMYALKDDIQGFKTIMNHVNLENKKSLNAFKMSFVTACDANSKKVLEYILENACVEKLNKDDFNKAAVSTSYKSNSEVMCILLSNETVLEHITFDEKLIYSINQIDNEKAFELMKCLLEKGKYKVSKNGEAIFLIAKDRANELLIEYLFVNTLAPGEQLPKNKMYEIMLTKEENIAPIFLNLLDKLNIEFSENEVSYLKSEKTELYNLLEKRNLFEKLNVKFENKVKVKTMKI